MGILSQATHCDSRHGIPYHTPKAIAMKSSNGSPRRLITVADDFGLSRGVNEAVERAARDGILTSTSLMVGAAEAEDAVQRARRLPQLCVGLHLVVIEGKPILRPEQVPDLVDEQGRFPSDQLRLGLSYFFRPSVRRELAAEIRAQFEAFAATGLKLDHANAHKHMHLHPTVGQLMIDIGRDYGLRAVRVPAEPAMTQGPARSLGDRLLMRWCAVLRHQASHAGMLTNDQIFGLGWTGHMTQAHVRQILGNLPPGLTELFFHPATRRDQGLDQLMPGYEHEAEFAALMESIIPEAVSLTSYSEVIAMTLKEQRH